MARITIVNQRLFASPQARKQKRFNTVFSALVLSLLVAGVWVSPWRGFVQEGFQKIYNRFRLRQLGQVVPATYGGYVVNQHQADVANTIIRTGIEVGASEADIKVALMTALAESDLQALDHGDLDSINAFQQRPSQDWPETLDTEVAAQAFFKGHGTNPGLFDIKDRSLKDPGDLAQEVQRSAYPERYGLFEHVADELVIAARKPTEKSLSLADVAVDALAAGDRGFGEQAFPLMGKTMGSTNVTSEFGWRYGGGKRDSGDRNFHQGIDLACAYGEPLAAVETGIVEHVDTDPDGYGAYAIALIARDGTEFRYGHVQKRLVSNATLVTAGTPVAECGSEGNSSGPHLHFEMWTSSGNQPINPRSYLEFLGPG
ncbi:MAG: M23 family metallopeptidase [Cyanobacteria bacterium P01_A01_bin.135]